MFLAANGVWIWTTLAVIVWIALAFWPARVAARKGHSFFGYFLFSIVFFPAALIVAYLVSDRTTAARGLRGGGLMPITEYDPRAAFPGVIGRTADESSPAWPAPVRAAEGAPNVLFIVLDDTGFGQLGCYGSPIETPNLDGIAANGLRYNNMHTTALCSPSRSCIVTGRNHHSNGMACITELATGYPGYNGVMPFENGMLSEMLLEHGYSTFMVGKWHLTPEQPGDRRRAVRPLAARPRLPALLRLPRRRHEPVVSGARLRQPPGRAAEEARGGLPPERGSRRQGRLVHRRQQAGRPAEAVLSAPVLRCDARPAPRGEGVGGQVQGRVRRRLGRLPGEDVRAPEGARDRARRRGAVTPRPRRPRLGRAARPGEEAVQPDDGGVRRLPRAHRSPDRPAARLPDEAR